MSQSRKGNPVHTVYPDEMVHLYEPGLAFILSQISPGASIADLGCGNGYVLERIAAECHPQRMLGVDCSYEMCRLARYRLAACSDVDIVCADIEHLAERMLGQFDYVIMRNAFHHFAEKDRVLRWCVELLTQPEGKTIIVDLDWLSSFSLRGLVRLVTIALAWRRLSSRGVWHLVRDVLLFPSEQIRRHEREDRERLTSQGWLRECEIRKQLERLGFAHEFTRLGSVLGLGGCYGVVLARAGKNETKPSQEGFRLDAA